MNERLRELAVECTFFTYGVNGELLYEGFNEEKFAELIVRECVGVVEGGRFLHDEAPTAQFARECAGAIRRHFGIQP